MKDITAHCLTYRPRIGSMAIGGDLIGNMPNHSNSLLKKLLSCLHIPFLTYHRINQIAIMIDSSIQVTPFAMDLDIRLISIPGLADLSTSLGSQLIRYQRSESCFPVTNGYMCERKTPRQKHLSQITQAQLIT